MSSPDRLPTAADAAKRALGWCLEALLGVAASLLALQFAHPLARGSAGTHIWGAHVDIYSGGGDLSGTLFLISRALFGESGRATRLLAWPFNRSLEGEFHNTLVTDLMAQVVQAVGWPEGYNLALLAFLVSNALAVQLAARLAGAGPGGGLLAALCAAPSAMIVNEILEGRPVTGWWAPAVAASALSVAALTRWRRFPLLIPGLLLFWTALEIYPYGPVLLAPWTVLAGAFAVLWGAPPAGGPEPSRIWGRGLRAILGGAAAVGVLYLYVEGSSKGTGDFARNPLQDDTLPPFRTLRYDDLLYTHVGGVQIARIPAALSAAALGLGLIGWRRIRLWAPALAGAVALMLVAMGSSFDFGGAAPGQANPRAPYVLLMNHVPPLRPVYRPDRYAMGATLLLPLALGVAATAAAAQAARGASWLAARLEARRLPWLFAGARLGGLAVAGFVAWWVLLQSRPSRAPHLLDWPPVPAIAELADEEALLDLPLVMLNDKGEMMMVAALPVKRANPTRLGLRTWRGRLGDEHPLLRAVAEIHAGEREPEDVPEALLQGVPEVALGLRYAVLHPAAGDAPTVDRYRRFLEALGAEGREAERGVILYALPPVE